MVDRIDLSSDMRRRAGLPPDTEQHPAAAADADQSRRMVAIERQRCVEVLRACALAGREDLGSEMITSGKTVGEVVQALNTRGGARRLGRA